MLPTLPAPPRQILPGDAWPLYDTAGTRRLEHAALAQTPAHALMQRAGLATARLAMALAPRARTVWVAAGPGNNGGDGMEAALHLHRWGRQVVVTRLGDPLAAPADAAAAHRRALDAGVPFAESPPGQSDLCIDALLGIGSTRAPQGLMAQWISHMHRLAAPVLAIDVPTGLDADTGIAARDCVSATATLCLLTLKPGLFTAHGRDASTQVWLDDLQVDPAGLPQALGPSAFVLAAPLPAARRHASHKGSYGDVAIVGGAPGMSGAALLAASAALHGGAGRVYLCPLDEGPAAGALNAGQPELMLRDIDALDASQLTVVCGCGGGDPIRRHLPRLLAAAARLVLDADALNALATDTQLQRQLRARAARGQPTILTPHPLEAARLLGITSQQVQQDRIGTAQRLARDYRCTVVLKGSGTIVADPAQTPGVNPTGNARLASAGTGDVLAGLAGALLAPGAPAFEAACHAVYLHGETADRWPKGDALTAGKLARALHRPE